MKSTTHGSWKRVSGVSILAGLFVLSSCQSLGAKHRDSGEDLNPDGMGYYEREDKTYAPERTGGVLQPKKKILVLRFWNNTPVPQESLGDIAADELRTLLGETNRVILSSEFRSPLKTQDYIQGESIRVAQLVQEGRKQGVSLILVGRISKITLRQGGDDVGLFRKKYTYASADLEVKMFDVQAGREVLSSFKTGEVSESALAALQTTSLDDPSFRAELTASAIRHAASTFVPDVIKSLEKTVWQGHVAKVDGKNIFVNAGHVSGISAGDILRVFGTGEDIYDPVTGAYLGRSPGKLKGTLEVTDFIGADGGVAKLHTGGNVQEGDLVQLY